MESDLEELVQRLKDAQLELKDYRTRIKAHEALPLAQQDRTWVKALEVNVGHLRGQMTRLQDEIKQAKSMMLPPVICMHCVLRWVLAPLPACVRVWSPPQLH